jgi:triosephosphate isomerase (TIM)
MRKKIVAGNWKMNKTLEEGKTLVEGIQQQLKNEKVADAEIIVAPPFIHLATIAGMLGKDIGLAAQNCASEPSGAFTGEVSAEMIRSAGAGYVIIGHSERRHYFGESGTVLKKKVELALEQELSPIFCCGEVLEERNSRAHFTVVERQLSDVLFFLSPEEFSRTIIAYEPVWAIGTGVTATPQQAQEMHAFIRGLIKKRYGESVAEHTTILYGGSCKPGNAAELFENPDVDGGLIGGASLKADDFIAIARAF